LNPFEIKLIRFENRIGCTVPPAPPVTAASNASPCCLTPHLAANDRAPPSHPGPPVSHAVPRRADPAALHCRATTRRGRAAAASTPRCRAAPCRAQGPLSLSLSRSTSTRRPPLRPPSPPLPFKTKSPPTGRILLPRVPFVSSVHARAPHTRPPLPRHPPHPLPATEAPPPRRTPPERRRRVPPSGECTPSSSFLNRSPPPHPAGLP
jgi:hypothetical protein